MATTIEAYLAQQAQDEAAHEALMEWALEQGLDPDAQGTRAAWEADVQAALDALY